MVKKLLYEFIHLLENGSINIYNEFSLQHELGIFLRNKLSDYKIEFERNTKYFNITQTIKHEIDIVIYNDKEKYAIELKFPLNGQYPEQMFAFIKDISFMEQLKSNGFTATYCLTITNDKNFYSGKKNDGIYSFFRSDKLLYGKIKKPTGTKNESIELKRTHSINWEGENTFLKYYIIEIN